MALGAMVGIAAVGAAVKIYGAKEEKDATKKAGKIQYKAISDSVERSRDIEKDRTAAEQIADAALQEANAAFKQSNEQKYANSAISSQQWAALNKERHTLELENIALGAAERAEFLRREGRANEIVEGRATTARWASGFAKSDVGPQTSLDAWVGTIKTTHQREMDWAVKAGQSQDALAMKDASLRFQSSEAERSMFERESLLGYETGEAQYDYYEAQRQADAVMRDVARQERESDRLYQLASGDASRIGANAAASARFIGAVGSGVQSVAQTAIGAYG